MLIALKDIWIDREVRQRKDIQVDDLMESIPLRGVLVPIIVTAEAGPEGEVYKLIAGERRYTASMKLGLPDIPAHLLSDLPPSEQRIIELEENLRRKDLGWQDQCLAMADIHAILSRQNGSGWSYSSSARTIGFGLTWFTQCCRVAKELHRDSIRRMDSASRAWAQIKREDERAGEQAVSSVAATALDAAANAFPEAAGAAASPLDDILNAPSPAQAPTASPVPARPAPLVLPADHSILSHPFLHWAPTYGGPPFNFIHCDCPAPSLAPFIACLGENLDRLMAHSGHLMFWVPADLSEQTAVMRMFAEKAPALAFSPVPLIWLKSDHASAASDPKRQPRHIYETALIASREDRPLVKSVPDAISAPTRKDLHPHTKPEPVLKHFFQLFVDPSTRLLDPACGSGAALRAAEALGAEHVLGLEPDDAYAESARRSLNHFRVLRAAASAQKEKEPPR